jgi:uncharacterized membrane protein
MDEETPSSSRADILDLMDGFIEKMLRIRRLILAVFISGIFLAPFAIGLSIFLMTHPRFFSILQREYQFGAILYVLLGVIISVSVVWFVAGIRQYREIKSWNKRYDEFLKGKDEMNKKIASKFGLEGD